MFNYIRADLRRILKRPSRYIFIILSLGIIPLFCYVANITNGELTSMLYLASVCACFELFIIFFGFIEHIYVFMMDFRAKSIEAAVGIGISRRKVVISKILVVLILSILDFIIALIFANILAIFLDVTLNLSMYKDIVVTIIYALVAILAFTSISTILAFYMSSANFSNVLYLILSCGFINQAVGVINYIEFFNSMNITQWTLTYQLNAFKTQLYIYNFNVSAFIIILVYFVLGVFLTCFIFDKKELNI